MFNIRNPVSPEGGIDFYSGGSYTYFLPWEINANVTVRVVIHARAVIESSDRRSCYCRDVFSQELIEPLAGASTKGAIYLPVLLASVGLVIIVLASYQRYGKRAFRFFRLFHGD